MNEQGKGCTTHFINFFMKWHFLYIQIPEMIISGMSYLLKKWCFLGKANTGHFIKNDLHEPCFLWNAFPELSVDMTCEANCTSAFYRQFPLKKSSNPCAMFAFECYFARILIHFLIYCSSSLTTRPSLSFDGRRRGRGRRRGGEEGQESWGHRASWIVKKPRCGMGEFREGGREKTGGGEKRGRRGGDMEPWCSHSASLNANESSWKRSWNECEIC